MDLQALAGAIWRFRILFLLGLAIALALGYVTYVRVSFEGGKPTFTYREVEQWESLTTLFLTTEGFPWGRVYEDVPSRESDEAVPSPPTEAIDPGRFTTLASLYLELATSDKVKRMIEREGPMNGALAAFPVLAGNQPRGEQLPMITLSAIADSPGGATELASRHARAFIRYVQQRQVLSGIPERERVRVEVVRAPQPPQLLLGRSKTRPIVIIVGIMTAVLCLIFALDNVRRSRRPPAVGSTGGQEFTRQAVASQREA